MRLTDIKRHLQGMEEIAFELPDGSLVPRHFHVTEVGKIDKHFIDCGGTVRKESVINFQLYEANDYDHRLHPEKLVHIIEFSEKVLSLEDHEIEVEYQGDTIGKYGLDMRGARFVLTSKHTDCLAKDDCGIPKKANSMVNLVTAESDCTPGGGCC